MKQIRLLSVFVLLLLSAAVQCAQAQNFGLSRRPLGQEVGKADSQPTKRKAWFGSVSIFPVSVFDIGGGFNSGVAGTQTLYGGLLDVELGVDDISKSRTKGRYTIGGWYWGRNGNDLYELHARAATPNGLGLQVGYLNTTQGFTARPSNTQNVTTDAEAVDVFVFYGFSSYTVGRKERAVKDYGNWNIEFGAGLFIDTSKHFIGTSSSSNTASNYSNNATANYTFYLSGSLQLKGNLSLQVTEWVLRDRAQELNRLTLGLGLSF